MTTTIALTDIAIGVSITAGIAVMVGIIATFVVARRDRRKAAQLDAARKRALDAAIAPDDVDTGEAPTTFDDYVAQREREYQEEITRSIADHAAELRRKREATYRAEWDEMREHA